MITEIIDMLMSADYYGGGKHIEFAKGSDRYVSTWKQAKRKIKRKWRSGRK